jgi:hypothetical protein
MSLLLSQAIDPELGGSAAASLDAVVAKLARAKAGNGYASAREALLLNSRFVLAQVCCLSQLDRHISSAEQQCVASASSRAGMHVSYCCNCRCSSLPSQTICPANSSSMNNSLICCCSACLAAIALGGFTSLLAVTQQLPHILVVMHPIISSVCWRSSLQVAAHEARRAGGAKAAADKGKGKAPAGLSSGPFCSELEAEVSGYNSVDVTCWLLLLVWHNARRLCAFCSSWLGWCGTWQCARWAQQAALQRAGGRSVRNLQHRCVVVGLPAVGAMHTAGKGKGKAPAGLSSETADGDLEAG